MDWRKKGDVTPIKDLGKVLLAFSAVATMEGITQLKTELVDCDTSGEDQGCEGGLMKNAFDFIQQNHGLSTEANYPYQRVDSSCNTNKEANHAAKTCLQIVKAHYTKLLTIDASGSDFQFYSSGVFIGECSIDLDHHTTAVGYGTREDGTKHWLVKNSWGSSWGEEGYIRMTGHKL
ncbi:hypothetical protein RJ639_030514 [Escallonia herrerae]|uniref:Peptidase C1A papain C-terminal domain-containing protein n=1 Tax=Escallonia herrerae TaxID=1293975 RepID=A0AA88XDT1_9ASTE|nr:hypothetical protein RJ639_030514 [Escallonia herrerae]